MVQLSGFSKLPVEVRLKIWLHSVPDDETEVCLPWPFNVPNTAHTGGDPLYELPCQPLTVDVAFPVAMHVCREARSAIQDSRRSGVRFRMSEEAGCPAPFRCFRPELDILYLSHEGIWFMDMFLWPECTIFETIENMNNPEIWGQFTAFLGALRLARRFALPAGFVPQFSRKIEEFFSKLSRLSKSYRTPRQLTLGLCYVVATTRNITEMDPEDVHAIFVPPTRRCRLAAIAEHDWDKVLVATDNIRSNPPQNLRKIIEETVNDIRSGGLLAPMDTINVTAGTFVEYQRDGTWGEACASRMYPREKMEMSSIVEIAPAERPNPEIKRVQDAGFEFQTPRVCRRPQSCLFYIIY